MAGWILGESSDELIELFSYMDEARCFLPSKSIKPEVLSPELPVCAKCQHTEFSDTIDCESNWKVCTKCGEIQFGSANLPCMIKMRTYGKTIYDPCERFRYWIELARGHAKLPKELVKKIEHIHSLTDLKQFLNQKQNRKYRKFYPSILKQLDEDLVEDLSNTEIESLLLNFTHVLSIHAKNRKKNEKTGRKKSLPHYIFLITRFLEKIGRDDLASNFLPMKCEKIKKDYEELINSLFH